MSEFANIESLSDKEDFERGFRNLFGSMDGMEAFSRYSRYPNVTVHPLAVFRRIGQLEVG
jgi:hypothetical protein